MIRCFRMLFYEILDFLRFWIEIAVDEINRMFSFIAESVGVDARLSKATDYINELEEIKGMEDLTQW